MVFSDERGYLYWHRAVSLVGDIYDQCEQILESVKALQIPSVTVETNGPGGFVPPVLRKTLAGTGVAVIESHTPSTISKDKRILDGLEPPLSGRFLWAHTSVLDTIETQMREWIPGASNQKDDYLDSGAEAIKAQPGRIGRIVQTPDAVRREDWRPASGDYSVTFER